MGGGLAPKQHGAEPTALSAAGSWFGGLLDLHTIELELGTMLLPYLPSTGSTGKKKILKKYRPLPPGGIFMGMWATNQNTRVK